MQANITLKTPITKSKVNASSVIKRLIEEVRIEKPNTTQSRYDRVHNRHNR